MKKRHLTIPALALILMAACTDATGVGSDPTSVEPDNLAGTWTATAIVFTSIANPTMSVDEIAEGAAMTLVLGADGTYALTFLFPGEPNENETGTYTVSGGTMTTTESVTGLSETIAIARVGDTMTLTLTDTYDFTEGVEEAAALVITLTR